MRRKFPLFLIILFVYCNMFYTSARAAHEAVLAARNNVVRILALDEHGNGAKGTGFAVGNKGEPVRYFVTNSHVVVNDPQNNFYPSMIIIIFEDLTKKKTIFSAKVIYSSSSLSPDVAILDIGIPVNYREPSKLLKVGNVRETDDVYAIGFPGTADDIDDGGQETLPSKPENATISKGIITKLKINNGNTECYQIDAVINHGNSGGPLVTEDGYIIGINTFGAVEGEGTNGAIYIDTLFPLFKRYNIPYILADSKVNSASKIKEHSSAATLVVIAGGVEIIIIIIAAMSKKGGKPSYKSVVLQEQADAQYMPQASAKPQDAKNPILIGVTGEYAGIKFPLQYGKIIIGKDIAFCNVVFSKNMPDISFQHCEVSYNKEGECFVVIDLGSAYGTFSVNGQKLTPGIPGIMREGEGFYLVNSQNKFIFEME